jgi:hypothetical protein
LPKLDMDEDRAASLRRRVENRRAAIVVVELFAHVSEAFTEAPAADMQINRPHRPSPFVRSRTEK